MIEPVRIPFSTKVLADGTFSVDLQPPALQSWYSMLLVTARQTFNGPNVVTVPPSWTFAAGHVALDFTLGSAVDLGPRLISPGETITISGTGGQPGGQISGILHGTRGDTAASLISGAYVPTASTLGVQQISANSNRRPLYPVGVVGVPPSPTFTVPAAATRSFSIPIPPGAVAIRLLAVASAFVFNYSLLVQGHTTQEQYYGFPISPGVPAVVPTPTLPFTIPIENDWDQQLDIEIVGDPNFAITFYISALFTPETPGQAGAAQSVTLVQPAPWLVPNSPPAGYDTGAIAVGGHFGLIVGNPGFTTRLFQWYLSTDMAAATIVTLQNSDGSERYASIFLGTTNPPPVTFFGAAAIPSGISIQIANTGSNPTGNLHGSLVFSSYPEGV